jgi:site-specific recombinase XerD
MTQANKTISPLRQRMLEDMALRRFSPKTKQGYIRHVVNFSRFLARPPDTADAEDLRRYQLYLVEQSVSTVTLNAIISALRFFYAVTLDRPEVMRKMRHIYEPRRIPEILSTQEVARVLESAGSLKYQAALGVSYGAGLRASEVVHLKVTDIDSQRMLIRVELGKGKQDRNAMLSPSLLRILRAWWQDGRSRHKMLPGGWLFPGQNPINPMSTRQLNRAFHAACQRAGIDKRVTLHSLRHAFATHLLEQHEDIRVIQVLLGHKQLNNTATYSHVAASLLQRVKGPLEYLDITSPG